MPVRPAAARSTTFFDSRMGKADLITDRQFIKDQASNAAATNKPTYMRQEIIHIPMHAWTNLCKIDAPPQMAQHGPASGDLRHAADNREEVHRKRADR